MKVKYRYTLSYKFFRFLGTLILPRKFSFVYDKIKVKHSPYIVVANHVSYWDPILITMSFKKHMYFLASDEIMRFGLWGKLVTIFFNPISKTRAVNETNAVINIFRRLRSGRNICIFPEGITTFDGETGKIIPSINKLIKKAGVSLVTYRFSGAYLTFPKWAATIRKGKLSGNLVRVYSTEEIKAMSEEELYKVIVNDLYANAYEEQKTNKIAFRGERLAEHLETVLYCCPRCREFAALTSKDDRLFCKCGFHVRYTEYGFFEGTEEEPPFTTILEWSKWQKEEMAKLAEKAQSYDSNTPVFTDHDQRLSVILKSKLPIREKNCTLSIYNNRLSIIFDTGSTLDFPFNTITEMTTFSNKTLVFSVKDNGHYEIKPKNHTSAIKYQDFFNLTVNRE